MSPARIIRFPVPRRERAASSSARRRIAFVINSLGPGGAERVMNNILHSADPQCWDVHLILLDREEETRTPPDFVTVHRLDCQMRLWASIQQLKRALRSLKPDVVVSFLVRANVASVIAARRLAIPVIISERSNLSAHLAGRYRDVRRLLAGAAPRLIYPRADRVIACSEGVRSDLVENFSVKPDLIETIHNPVDFASIVRGGVRPPEIALPERFMISVGRLVEAKGFADLIEAYAAAQPEIPLCILGEGPDRAKLEAMIGKLGLADRVLLLGYTDNPFAILSRAEFYVSASRCEGFPNALAEAMAIGLPSISTDCPSGPAEILANVESTHTRAVLQAKYGILVPVGQTDAMAHALELMSHPKIRAHYGRMAQTRMRDFRLDKITDRYWSAFGRVLGDPPLMGQPASARADDRDEA